MGKKVILQHPTQRSGITAVYPVQNSDSGAASLRVSSRQRVFAAPHDGSACTFVTRLFAPIWTASGDSSLRFAVFVPSPSLTFFFTFVVFFAARPLFCSELKVFDDGLRCQTKVASPTFTLHHPWSIGTNLIFRLTFTAYRRLSHHTLHLHITSQEIYQIHTILSITLSC